MLSKDEVELLHRINVQFPLFQKFLEQRLESALRDLPSVGLDKVQVFQGRALMLQDIIADFKGASVSVANRK